MHIDFYTVLPIKGRIKERYRLSICLSVHPVLAHKFSTEDRGMFLWQKRLYPHHQLACCTMFNRLSLMSIRCPVAPGPVTSFQPSVVQPISAMKAPIKSTTSTVTDFQKLAWLPGDCLLSQFS